MQGTRDQELASHCRDRIHCSDQIRTWETLASWYVNWPTCIKSSIDLDPEYVAPAVYHRGRGLIMVELEYPQIWPGERARHTRNQNRSASSNGELCTRGTPDSVEPNEADVPKMRSPVKTAPKGSPPSKIKLVAVVRVYYCQFKKFRCKLKYHHLLIVQPSPRAFH